MEGQRRALRVVYVSAHHVNQAARRLVKHAAEHSQWEACDADVSHLTRARQPALESTTSSKRTPAFPVALSVWRAGFEVRGISFFATRSTRSPRTWQRLLDQLL